MRFSYFRVNFPIRWLCQLLRWIVCWYRAAANRLDEPFWNKWPVNPSSRLQCHCTECAYRINDDEPRVLLFFRCVALRLLREYCDLRVEPSIWLHPMHSYWNARKKELKQIDLIEKIVVFEDPYCATQCAAVKMWFWSMSEPPQNCLPLLKSTAIHGHSFGLAVCPPTMRSWSWLPFFAPQ